MKKITRMAVLCVAVGALFLSGCATFFTSPKSSSSTPGKNETISITKGETAAITGRLQNVKNQFVLTDAKSGVSYRLVGLKKAEAAQLSSYLGNIVTLRLVVKSTESAKAYIAQLVAIVK